MSFNVNTVLQMIQPVLNAAFEADQRASQVQAQLDTMSGQLRSTQSELSTEKAKVRDLQTSLNYVREEKRGILDRCNRDVQTLNRKVEEINEHHRTCSEEVKRGFEDRERRIKQSNEDQIQALRQQHGEVVEALKSRILTEEDAKVLLNVKGRGCKKAALAILTRSFYGDYWSARDLLKKVLGKGARSSH